MANLKQKTESSDMNHGVLPFKFTIPAVKYVIENGRKAVRYSLGIYYHLIGFTKGAGHAKLLRIEMDLPGDNDPDILPVLMDADAIEKVEEYEQIAAEKSTKIYWTQNNLIVAQ